MAFPRIGGAGIPLSVVSGLVPNYSGSPPVAAGITNVVTLPAGETFVVPGGTYFCAPGPYTALQWNDPVSGLWRNVAASNQAVALTIDSDGANFRLANITGTPVGGLITNAGTGYTNGIGTAVTGLTITPSAGASTWVPVVGGSINSTVTITAGGTGYLFAPQLVIDAPPAGGIQASATCTISAGAINAVTVTNQGAGYTAAPAITIVNDPRDTAGRNAVLTVNATLAGSGILTAMYPSNYGNPVTAVPTFTFSPASTTAVTAVMNFTVTGLTVTGGGTGVPAGSALVGFPTLVAGTRASNTAGPINDTGLTMPRAAWITPSISGGVIQGSGNVIVDAGYGFQAVPIIGLISTTGVAPTAGTNITATVGGTTDTSWLQRI
jgi:hypothetical protein